MFLFTAGAYAVSLQDLTASCITESNQISDFGDCSGKDSPTCGCKESAKLLTRACERSTSAAAESCGSKINVNPCVSQAFTDNFNSEVKSLKAKVTENCDSLKAASLEESIPVAPPIKESTQVSELNEQPSEYKVGSASERVLTNCKNAFRRSKIMKSCETKMFNDCVCQNYEAEQTLACDTSVALQVEACREFRKKDDLMATCLLQHKSIQEKELKKANNRMEKACKINFTKANLTEN